MTGKSTLLKVIAGILRPDSGKAKVYGSIAPLIELGAGFDHNLTAKENIFFITLTVSHETSAKEVSKKLDFVFLLTNSSV